MVLFDPGDGQDRPAVTPVVGLAASTQRESERAVAATRAGVPLHDSPSGATRRRLRCRRSSAAGRGSTGPSQPSGRRRWPWRLREPGRTTRSRPRRRPARCCTRAKRPEMEGCLSEEAECCGLLRGTGEGIDGVLETMLGLGDASPASPWRAPGPTSHPSACRMLTASVTVACRGGGVAQHERPVGSEHQAGGRLPLEASDGGTLVRPATAQASASSGRPCWRDTKARWRATSARSHLGVELVGDAVRFVEVPLGECDVAGRRLEPASEQEC